MATLTGEGAFNGVNLIVSRVRGHEYTDKESGEVKAVYLDVQVDQSLKSPDKILEGKAQADTNPHLVSNKTVSKNAKGEDFEWVDHRARYAASQFDKIVAAAGKKTATIETTKEIDGETKTIVTDVYGIQGDLMTSTNNKTGRKELLINTAKPMSATKNPRFGKSVLERQEAVIDAARSYRDAQKAAQAEAGVEVETQAQAEAEAQPEM